MADKNPLQRCFLFTILSVNLMFLQAETDQISSKNTYVIHMDKSAMPLPYTNHLQWYTSKINSVTKPNQQEEQANTILYTYQTAFHGLAARLTQEEAEKLEEQDGVVAVIPETKYELHTTRSPTFLGLERPEGVRVWSERNTDHDVTVGILDTGIWPESESFNDTGMSPVPSTWRGACETGKRFLKSNCNKKIVGARVFYKGYEAATGKIDEELEYRSPRDRDGHGTHTAATVAGSPVRGANLLGYAYGTARGMAPKARVAAYKACWVGGCFSSDILSAVDQAVSDGVHVLSISLGGGISTYSRDSLAIATFGAMEMGVFVSCSAGNSGPVPVSLTNVSPWITTVAASTMDRDFPAMVKLGTNRSFKGVSLYKGRTVLSRTKQYPLVYLGKNASSPDPTSFCLDGALDRYNVVGKIVICDRGVTPRVQKGQVVKRAGGIGMILTNTPTNGEELVADSHLLPTIAVGEKEGTLIKHYAMTSKRATASLEIVGTRIGIKPSPVVAAFSSRGPNFLSLEILKPDLLAPGVNILAAWSGDMAPSSLSSDPRRVKFNILSGTSMSCPHVSGVAAFIKSRHPDWSPAAIKSALMTTAYVHDNTFKPLTDAASVSAPSSPYDHGAGHIDPLKAIDPGLVYDITPQDYFEFLCTQELSPSQLKVFTKHSNRNCKHTLSNNPGNLNYPAISALFPENTRVKSMFLVRTVTNVGPHIASYKAYVSPFKGATVTVQPKTLNFTGKHQKLSYTVTFRTKLRMKQPEFGGILWKSATHKVRSPVIITWLPPM
ncbi:unnamed protein product [Cochlearia groenlandica]